jgi:hypothetical protein
MTRAEFLARWRQRRDDFDRLTAAVEGRALLDAVLSDLEQLFAQEEDFALTLREAARESGSPWIIWPVLSARGRSRTPAGVEPHESGEKTSPERPRPCPAGALPRTLEVPHLSRSRGPS